MKTVTLKIGDTTIKGPQGTRLMDLCEEAGSPIVFGCGEAACGSCAILVLENLENLSPCEEQERIILESLNAGPSERLACQCRIFGDVRVQVMG